MACLGFETARLRRQKAFSFRLRTQQSRRMGVIFWAVTIVNSPREMNNVRMAVGSNSASMWWLNGKDAVDLFDDRRMVMDDVVSESSHAE